MHCFQRVLRQIYFIVMFLFYKIVAKQEFQGVHVVSVQTAAVTQEDK